ncbi:unnamed protein product [Prunus armeniaca]|uniref:Uncharacterized protein n=1 Tax=Prunus armeniaca TaxID=36596 RepID=A0A6J5UNT8_PRUAR|nr:unnamed protein product [Prunus armeniaca]
MLYPCCTLCAVRYFDQVGALRTGGTERCLHPLWVVTEDGVYRCCRLVMCLQIRVRGRPIEANCEVTVRKLVTRHEDGDLPRLLGALSNILDGYATWELLELLLELLIWSFQKRQNIAAAGGAAEHNSEQFSLGARHVGFSLATERLGVLSNLSAWCTQLKALIAMGDFIAPVAPTPQTHGNGPCGLPFGLPCGLRYGYSMQAMQKEEDIFGELEYWATTKLELFQSEGIWTAAIHIAEWDFAESYLMVECTWVPKDWNRFLLHFPCNVTAVKAIQSGVPNDGAVTLTWAFMCFEGITDMGSRQKLPNDR